MLNQLGQLESIQDMPFWNLMIEQLMIEPDKYPIIDKYLDFFCPLPFMVCQRGHESRKPETPRVNSTKNGLRLLNLHFSLHVKEQYQSLGIISLGIDLPITFIIHWHREWGYPSCIPHFF